MQAEGIYAGPGEHNISSGDLEHYDKQRFNALMTAFNDSANKLAISKTIFDNEKKAEGTELIFELTSELRKMRKMTNNYKTFMTKDISGLITQCLENINSAENISGDSVGVTQK